MLCDIEKGRRIVTAEMAKKAAKALDYSIKALVILDLQDEARRAGVNIQLEIKKAA